MTDYIVVGAGTAGCVLARRLSDDPAVRVVLLEAGGRDAHPLLRVPWGVGRLHPKRMFDWGYDTVVEPGMADRELVTLRGKVLGGSSAINFMAFTHGAPGDFDRWARSGAPGWSWNDLEPYFRRVRSMVHVVASDVADPLAGALQSAAQACGYPLTDDYNCDTFGFGRTQFNLHAGRRHSAWRAYVHPVRRRPNLVVRTASLVHRVAFEGNRAVGVVFEQDGQLQTLRADREVILSGGSINTPQLLMLSGIGPADHLRSHGIAPLADLPVGNNLQDHLKGVLLWRRREPPSAFRRVMRYDRAAAAFALAYVLGRGPATMLPFPMQGYIRTDPALEVPDLEFMLRSTPIGAGPWFPFVAAPFVDAYGLDPVILHPQSRGTIRLRSADPHARPLIHYNYFSEPADIAKMRDGFRRARELGEHAAFAPYRARELSPGPDVQTDAAIDGHLRATSSTVSHPIGTARMGTSDECVVDPELRVRGVERLRVVDASVFPDLVSAHTNAAVYAVAERASNLIAPPVIVSEGAERGSRTTA